MAARLNPRHSEMVRSKIRTTQLLKRLDAHVHGTVDLTPSQVQAATFLVSMSLSKPVQQVEAGGGNVTVQIVRFSDAAE